MGTRNTSEIIKDISPPELSLAEERGRDHKRVCLLGN